MAQANDARTFEVVSSPEGYQIVAPALHGKNEFIVQMVAAHLNEALTEILTELQASIQVAKQPEAK